ncbi:galactoside alpha-(1,2)-fucosyltransferase 2-like [Biomphalaria glabrata]|uniref:L-Fucosyltransferase n=1 Tax=Biomphalaria glabrata TaxID=6526 RepID=A0A9W2Z7S4_BIOGL|nr:galactoside alpha-(1,2)-fucosyltransferase 2-like [Biomphalaria glabrata]XP_055871048.1 galactoside alpha-(1,2)-fucosyltransferase 2-like [Biomphalaria glabrata]
MQRRLFFLVCGSVFVGLSILSFYNPIVTFMSTLDSSISQIYIYTNSSANKENTFKLLSSPPNQTISLAIESSSTTTTTTTQQSTTSQANVSALYLTTRFMGRLGNQMFIYATMVGLARAQNRVPVLKSGGDLVTTFQITNLNKDMNTDGWNVISESAYAIFNSKFMNLPPRNLIVTGYLQSWRYFQHAQDEIRREFTFVPSIQKEADAVLASCRSQLQNHVIVGVHVRRGDFVSPGGQKYGYGVADGSYFVKAFAKIRSLLPNQNITFLVASDDMTWCKNNLNDSSVKMLSEGNAGNHFAILSSCDHVILTGGTFGWWVAWLANGITIYYKDFIRKNTPLQSGFSDRDYYPPGWIGVEN